MLPLIITKEEKPVALDGAAESSPVLILLKDRALAGKIAFRIESRVTKKLKRGAVESIRAGLGHNIDQSAAVVAVFGIGIGGQNAKLGDGIEVGNDSRLLADTFLHTGPIQRKPVGVLALAVDRKLPGVCFACGRNRTETAAGRAVPSAAGGDRGYANLQGQKVGVAPAVQGNLCDFLGTQNLPELG